MHPGGANGQSIYMSHPDSWSILVECGDFRKWVSISQETYDSTEIGSKVVVELKPWEQAEHLNEVQAKINQADSFETLEAVLRSLGGLDTPDQHYTADSMIQSIEFVKNKGSQAAYFFITKTYGLRDKVRQLEAEYVKKQGETLLGRMKNKLRS